MKTTSVKIGELIVDENIYPRHKISEHNVRQLKEAFKSGASLPAILVDGKTKKIVDGWHRVEAAKALGHTEIEAEIRNYDSMREMLMDAVQSNAIHGYRLTIWDQVRSIIKLQEFGASREQILKVLSITPDKMEKLEERIVEGPAGEKEAAKGSTSHIKKMTIEQEEYNRGPAPGLSVNALLSQIVRALEAGAVEMTEKTRSLFEQICMLYQEYAE